MLKYNYQGTRAAHVKFILQGGNSPSAVRKEAELFRRSDHGFEALVIGDGYAQGGTEGSLEANTALAYLADKVQTNFISTLVTPIPLRDPVALAKTITTIDILSGGRAGLGVGAGQPSVGWAHYGTFESGAIRFEKTVEALDLMKRLWTGEEVTFKGKYYSVDKAKLLPRPISKPYPVLLSGAQRDKMLEWSGATCDIVAPAMRRAPDLKTFLEAKEAVMRGAKKAGREHKVKLSYRASFLKEGQTYSDPKETEQRLADAKKAGCSYYIVRVGMSKFEEGVRRFEKEVISSYK